MIKLFAALLVVALSACSSNPIKDLQTEKRLLLAPERAPVASKTYFADTYLKTMTAAQTDPTQVPAFIDAGNARNAMACSDWLNRVTTNKRALGLSDKGVGVLEGLVTSLAGIMRAGSTAVAALGAAEAAYSGFGDALNTDVLLAPSQYQVQSTLLGLQSTCADQLTLDAPRLRFSQAITRLDACGRVCSFEAAQAAANQALSATAMVVHPQTGALTVLPK